MATQCLQWIHSRLVQPGTTESLDGPNPFTWSTEVWPFQVPAGHWLGFTHISMSSKFTDGGAGARASYLVIPNVIALPDNWGAENFRPPIVIPEGVVLTAQLINNDAEPQWMNSIVTGLLRPKFSGQNYRDAFSDLV